MFLFSEAFHSPGLGLVCIHPGMVLLVSIFLDLLSVCFYALPFPGSCLLSIFLLGLLCSSVVPGSLVVRYLVVMLLGCIYDIVH